jgi:hypothetical protein
MAVHNMLILTKTCSDQGGLKKAFRHDVFVKFFMLLYVCQESTKSEYAQSETSGHFAIRSLIPHQHDNPAADGAFHVI